MRKSRFVLYFEEINDITNKGYYVRSRKVGFYSGTYEMARKMTYTELLKVLDHLNKDGELDYYYFTIKKVEV